MADIPDNHSTGNTVPLLEARGIGRENPEGAGWLYKDISLAIDAGQRVGTIGPTGAGKSLLLRALAFLDPLDAGEILWRGKPVGGGMVPAFRRRAIYLHQRPAIFPGTVEDNLRQPKARRASRFNRERVVKRLAEVARPEEFLARSSQNLSGGERQIVTLLRALELDPDLLLLDEPTAALDADSTAAVETLIARWRYEEPHERSLIWVSHDVRQAERIADRVLVLRDGRIEKEYRP